MASVRRSFSSQVSLSSAMIFSVSWLAWQRRTSQVKTCSPAHHHTQHQYSPLNAMNCIPMKGIQFQCEIQLQYLRAAILQTFKRFELYYAPNYTQMRMPEVTHGYCTNGSLLAERTLWSEQVNVCPTLGKEWRC